MNKLSGIPVENLELCKVQIIRTLLHVLCAKYKMSENDISELAAVEKNQLFSKYVKGLSSGMYGYFLEQQI